MEDNAKKDIRVFFALWPNALERAALGSWQAQMQPLCGGRSVLDANLHLTLVFLGDIGLSRVESLLRATQEIESDAFALSFKEARYWGHNHIVHAEPESIPHPLSRLVDLLQQILRRHGYNIDQRAYKPHVTLIRHAHCTGGALPAMAVVKWQVEEFVLLQSSSLGGGVRYQVLARYPLAREAG